jgi:serine phosphatase RsbU (regulator of sigma subunit)
VLRDSFVSRRHATVEHIGDGFELVDQKSSHGTFVNGSRIDRVLLHPGDILQFGSPGAIKIRFHNQSDFTHTETSLAEDLLSALSRISGKGTSDSPAARGMEQLNFLLSAARKLNAGGAKTDILLALLQLSIQLTGVDRGFVFLRENGEMRQAFGLRADGEPVQEDATVSHRAMQRAIESASKFSVSDTLTDEDAASWESVMVNSIRCIYCIPLRKHVSAAEPDHLLGLLYLDSQGYAGHLSAIDHELLDTIAGEAATLLDNVLLAENEMKSRRAAEELAVAAKIHAGLMSIALPTASYATLQARAVPCREIGGDFYDAVMLDDCLGVVLADVSGKGVPASIVAATLQGIIHAQLLTGQPLAQIAALVNRFLYTRSVGKYATMILLKLYPDGQVEYVNCGHIRPLLITSENIQPLLEANLMVGLIEGASYTASHCRLSPGDRILLATDGVTEAENGTDEQFGDTRFLAAARLETLDAILERVNAFQALTPAQDDCTMLAVRYEGHSAP